MSLKNIFGLLKTEKNTAKNTGPHVNPEFNRLLKATIEEARQENKNSGWYNISLGKLRSYQDIKSKDVKIRKALVFYLVDQIVRLKRINNKKRSWTSGDPERFKQGGYSEILANLLKSNLEYTVAEIIRLISGFKDADEADVMRFTDWPVGFSVKQVERIVKKEGLSPELKQFLTDFLDWPQMSQRKHYWGSDLEKTRVKLEKWLFENDNTSGRTAPYMLPDDRLAKVVNSDVKSLNEEQQDDLYELFHLFIQATASKPSAKYLKDTGHIIDRIGIQKYKHIVHPWIAFVHDLKAIEVELEYTGGGRVYQYSTYEFLHNKNHVFLKGLVWSLAKFHDSTTLDLVGKLAERSFKKIPGTGPAAASIGNACLYVLGNTRGLEGISHLSRLKLRIKQNNTRKLIRKYLDEASDKLGISTAEIEEMSIPDLGLTAGEKEVEFDEYTLKIAIEDLGKIALSWIKPDGSKQKTVPAFVKNTAKHSQKLKKIKAGVNQVKKYLTAQRDRVDRSYLNDREWDYEAFLKNYINHGLVGFVAKKLIWQFKKDGKFVSAIYRENKWTGREDEVLTWITNATRVRLWHPIYEETEEVLAWRNKLEELQVKQPLKQVYREVYVLTDAEVNTRSYSNRMAAHILKQHQFNALTAVRGWKYSLMGAYDDGRDHQMATISVREHGLAAQFWIDEIASDDQFNEAGIWNYVATDQVRFVRDGETVDLIDIPKLVLSEIMRDVDLFVGVCSVGNDPEWRDNGGLPQYRDYWTGYSFGDLTAIARTRKDMLEKLLPRLKINKVAAIDGKFLKIKGTKRTYKIHIGSSNILMEPNDQYLCIVPDQSKVNTATRNVFLPFEGDKGLSLVLSKAFLLAEDDKITDRTILSQINGN